MKQKDSVFCFFYTRFSQPYLGYEIENSFRSGSDSRAEIAGANLLQISEFGEFGLSAFLQNNLYFCVREELVIAIQELNLMSSKELTKICEKAGFNIEFLLKNKRI